MIARARPNRPSLPVRILLPLALALAPASASAGVVDGVRTVDDLTIYLGIVPAAIVRAHPPAHEERRMHGGGSAGLHEVHLLVAVFSRATGDRLRDVRVIARLHGTNANRWTVPLRPMTVNGVLTFGGYTSLGLEDDVMVSVDIVRANRTLRTATTTAQFEYRHD